jgi:RHS repeat-associated protein
MLDDSGIIHMNGRLYDAELGRMLSADPYVQVPEYSQNFNRYSYVLNNPLNKTDPTGYSWLSKAFHKIGAWVKENWRTVVAIVLAVAFFFIAPVLVGAVLSATGAVFTPLVTQAIIGATAGFLSGAANAALAGGDLGDVLRGGLVGAVQGAISSGPLHSMEGATSYAGKAAHVIGHGATGGAANVAMGGKFQDGFLSAAAGAAATHTGLYGKFQGSGIDKVAGRTAVAAVIGGTASALGGGKFANGAWTAAFQHLLNHESGVFAHVYEGLAPNDPNDPSYSFQVDWANHGIRETSRHYDLENGLTIFTYEKWNFSDPNMGGMRDATLDVMTIVSPFVGGARIGILSQGTNRALWSGITVNAARQQAQAYGLKTLDMTIRGRLLNLITTPKTYPYLRPAWDYLSKQWAAGAKGNVHFFGNPNRAFSTFNRVEKRELILNGTKIIYH